jgi:hypothetical protein
MKYMSYTASTVLIGLLVAVLWIAVGLEFGFKKSKQISYLTSTFCVVLAIKSITVLVDMITLFMGHDPVLSTSPVEALCVLLVEFKYENHLGYLIRTRDDGGGGCDYLHVHLAGLHNLRALVAGGHAVLHVLRLGSLEHAHDA